MSIKQAQKKPVMVHYVQLLDNLDEVLHFIDTLPRRAIWNHENGGFSEWDNFTSGDTVGILVFNVDGTMRSLVKQGSYVVKDQEGGYLFMTEEAFQSQFDVAPEIKPSPTPTATVSVVTENTNSTTTPNTSKTTKAKSKV